MISRVIAEFSSPELAETAVSRIKESVDYVYSGNIMYSRSSVKRHFLSRGTNYAVLSNSYRNSAASELNEEQIQFGVKRKNTTACIICGSGAVENVVSVINAMGGTNIRSVV